MKTSKRTKHSRTTRKRGSGLRAVTGSEIREKHTRRRHVGGRKYNVYLAVECQSFCVVESVTLKAAEWWRDMLTIALKKLISPNK